MGHSPFYHNLQEVLVKIADTWAHPGSATSKTGRWDERSALFEQFFLLVAVIHPNVKSTMVFLKF